MRLIAGVLLLILVVGSISCRWTGISTDPPRFNVGPWVRTAGGWERLGPGRIPSRLGLLSTRWL